MAVLRERCLFELQDAVRISLSESNHGPTASLIHCFTDELRFPDIFGRLNDLNVSPQEWYHLPILRKWKHCKWKSTALLQTECKKNSSILTLQNLIAENEIIVHSKTINVKQQGCDSISTSVKFENPWHRTPPFGKQNKKLVKKNVLLKNHHILNMCFFSQNSSLLFKIWHTQDQEAGCTKLNLKLLSELLYARLLWLVVSWLVHASSLPSGISKLNLKLACDGSQMTALCFTKQDFLFGVGAVILTLSWAETFSSPK